MSDITVRFIESDVEHVISAPPHAELARQKPKVEILTNGAQRAVFVNGHRIDYVTSIETPRDAGQVGPSIVLGLHASEVVERLVGRDEWNALTGKVSGTSGHPN